MNRAEHIAWCKERALYYCDQGDLPNAFASLTSDLRKHPQTKDHAAGELGAQMMVGGLLDTPAKMREFIEGLQ